MFASKINIWQRRPKLLNHAKLKGRCTRTDLRYCCQSPSLKNCSRHLLVLAPKSTTHNLHLCRWTILTHSNLRYKSLITLTVPRVRSSTFGSCSFASAGPTVWNSLPNSLHNPAVGPDKFQQNLKTRLLPVVSVSSTVHQRYGMV